MRYVPIGNKRGALRYFRYVRTAEGSAMPPGELPKSLAGPAFDAHVAGLLAGKDPDAPQPDAETILRCVDRIAVFGKLARLILTAEGRARAGTDDLVIDLTPFIDTRRRRNIIPSGRAARPIRAETRATLLESIARARHWLDELASGTVTGIDELSRREGQTPRQITATLSCAFVAPDIVADAIEGTLPDGAGVARMKDMPLEWDRQRRYLRL